MALFGDLQDHALTDLLKVLAVQTGTLYFHEAYQGRTLELTLTRGQLRALYLDGFPVMDSERAQEILRDLGTRGRGAFEFQRREHAAGALRFYDLPLGGVLDAGTGVTAEHLPHADTRFVTAPGTPSVPAPLAGTWAVLRPALESGASAAELTRQVGWSEQDLRVALYRLRGASLITPLRAAAPGAAAAVNIAPVPPAPAPASAPLVQRLLGALRRLGGGARA
ncbi:hypothetical protein QOL99_13920 [Deinococcus sp. MIMF12]|uniref:DUF4388 domain-containing protein n=1 Tax=Deinococcus rhizophilus TaxID=3049544 RepID=A0ABT7JJJ5_9DEIO|nr:hypothetical protein [Deinococcus rhizophilus]MDL2345237.1 hypothetical protein [Deinococcus rhizophilus]